MKKISLIIKILILFLFTIIIVSLGLYVYAFITPKLSINTQDNIIFYDKNGNNMFENNNDKYVKLDEINDNVKNAIISIEDKNFYNHKGFDFLRIIKAIFVNLFSGEIKEGASTISQQYVKNLYLTFDKTWKRKIEEAYLTIELETHYSKDDILEGYLNTIDFGAGNYGIKNASNYYFNKNPDELSLEEATILVGIPKSPTYYNPLINYKNAKKRQKDVLISMYNNNYINKEDIDKIYNKELSFYGKYKKDELSSINYYKDAVLYELSNIKEIPYSMLNLNGLKIYTNLDVNVQKELENNINNEMSKTTMQVASIVVEPKTGKIISLIGGKNYSISQFNRAIYSKRQVGSTIKPFLYYSALENGFTASTNFYSERTTFNLGDNTYSPKNANNIYANRNISLLSAIAYSDNIYAMKTHLFLGADMLSKTIKRVKINEDVKEVASSALGTSEINIIDYSNGFITLANEGKHEKPHLIEKITDINDNIIYEYKYKNEQLLNNKYVFILNNLLTSTYNYSMINYTSPTLISISNELDSKFAVKSGSTSTDYWTIGYNNNYLVMVWAGNDDNKEVKSSESKITKKIWAKTINKINNDSSWYNIPDGITIDTIDIISGQPKDNGYICYYEKGSEPSYINYNLFDNDIYSIN
ncbi:MAG: transglycosylase domain-containing protein [Bacilli bacterium]|nr:transglycosylase domain-containing protein [Bacilli bacterium]